MYYFFLLFKWLSCIQYTERIQWPKQQNDVTDHVSGIGTAPVLVQRVEGGLYYLQVRVHQACESLIMEKKGGSFEPLDPSPVNWHLLIQCRSQKFLGSP